MTRTKHPFAKLTVAASLATIDKKNINMNKNNLMKAIATSALSLCIVAGGLLPTTASAAVVSVTGGTLTVNLDRDKWGSLNLGTPSVGLYDGVSLPKPGLYLEEFFNQAVSASLPISQLGSFNLVPGLVEIPATGLQFITNGAVVTNLVGHHDKPTNFSFDNADLTGSATGAIGFGGIMRTRGNFGAGMFAIGELTLQYDAARNVDGASGWFLENHVSFPLPAFDLLNVNANIIANTFTLTGDLRFTQEMSSAFFAEDDALKMLGNVSLQATTTSPVPLPAAVWLFGSAIAGLGMVGRRKRMALLNLT
jgi:hypothetical protein